VPLEGGDAIAEMRWSNKAFYSEKGLLKKWNSAIDGTNWEEGPATYDPALKKALSKKRKSPNPGSRKSSAGYPEQKKRTNPRKGWTAFLPIGGAPRCFEAEGARVPQEKKRAPFG